MGKILSGRKLFTIGQAARKIGVHIETLRRWDKAGRIKTIKTPGGQRRYSAEEIKILLKLKSQPRKPYQTSTNLSFQDKFLYLSLVMVLLGYVLIPKLPDVKILSQRFTQNLKNITQETSQALGFIRQGSGEKIYISYSEAKEKVTSVTSQQVLGVETVAIPLISEIQNIFTKTAGSASNNVNSVVNSLKRITQETSQALGFIRQGSGEKIYISYSQTKNNITTAASKQVLGVETVAIPLISEIQNIFSKTAGSASNNVNSVVNSLKNIKDISPSISLPAAIPIIDKTPGEEIISTDAKFKKDVEISGNLQIKGEVNVNKLKANIVDPYLIENTGDVQSSLEIRTLLSSLGPADIVFSPGAIEKFRIKEGGDIVFSGSLSGINNITATGEIKVGSLSIDGNTFSSTKLIFSGSSPSIYPATTNSGISLNGNGTGAINIGNSGTGDIYIAGGSGDSGCTITNSNGSLNCSSNITSQADIDVRGGDLTTNQTTFNLINATATTLNVGGASTTISIGASTGTTTVNNAATITGAASLSSTLAVTGNTTLTGDLAVNGADITSTATTFNFLTSTVTTLNLGGSSSSVVVAGRPTFTKVPTSAHTGTFTIDSSTWNVSDASIYVNPASATADSNLLGVAVNGNVKFDVDAEGDIFGRNLVLTGNTTTGTTTVSGDLSVEGNTTLGDATTDTFTLNPATLTWAGGNKILDITGAATRTLTLLNSTVSQVADLDLSDGSLLTGGTSRLTNAGVLQNITGYTQSSGNFSISGTGTFGTGTGAISLNGAITASSTLAVTGNTTLTGDLAVNGGDITTTATTLNIDVGNTGSILLRDGTNTLLTIADAGTVGNVTVSGTLTSTGVFTASSTSTLAGDITFSSGTPNIAINNTETLTITDGTNTLLTIADGGTTGNLTATGTLAVTGNTTLTGDLAVNGGDITTTATTFALVNTTATTVNFAGAATTLSIGASTGTTTVNNALTVTGAGTFNNTFTNTNGTASNSVINLTSTGDLVLQDAGVAVLTFTDSGILTLAAQAPTESQNIFAFTNTAGAGTSYDILDIALTAPTADAAAADTARAIVLTIPTPAEAADTIVGLAIVGATATAGTEVALDIPAITAGAGTETALRIGSGWDTVLDSNALDISGAGVISGATGLSSSGTITFSTLTASRLVATDASSNLTNTITSANTLASVSDETGTGFLVFGTSPDITTSITTGSTTFALVNTTATTVNFAGAATTLSVGASTGTTTVNNALTSTGLITANAGVTVAGGQNLTLSSGTGQFSQTYTGTTTNAGTFTANSLTTGNALRIAFTQNAALNAGSTATGLSIAEAAATNTGNTSNLISLSAAAGGTVNGVNISSATGFTNFFKTPTFNLDSSGNVSGVPTLTATTLAGTLSTAAQTNVTSVGTLTSLAVTGNINSTGGALQTNSVTRIDNSGNLTAGTGSFSGTVTIGSGTGKVDVGTVDPPYTINGEKYATYLPAITGQKEETTGLIRLGSDKKHEIDFAKSEKASDLWLFYQITDFGKNWENLTVLLTPSFDGNVWYTKDPVNQKIIIEANTSGEVSYRLTSARFDFEKWQNTRPSTDSTPGFVLPGKN